MTVSFGVVSNPEFLVKGAALEDFTRPDRFIVGADNQRAVLLMSALYSTFTRNRDRVMVMDIKSAEFTKYAVNAMLATRVSFMNELALLADKLGVDIELVRKGSGSHPRIGYDFLYAGAGYGGSCFPKDVKALIKTAHNASIDLKLLKAVEAANERQKHVLVDKVVARFGDNLAGRHFGLWGLAFKPNTDDMREAPSRVIIVELLRKGAAVKACDPKAMAAARSVLPVGNELRLVDNQQEVLAGSEALVIVTDWKEFKNPDFETIKALLKQPVVIDGHTLYEPTLMQSLGFEYIGIGRAGTLALTEQSGSRRSPG